MCVTCRVKGQKRTVVVRLACDIMQQTCCPINPLHHMCAKKYYTACAVFYGRVNWASAKKYICVCVWLIAELPLDAARMAGSPASPLAD